MTGEHSASNYISLRAKRANLPRALEILRKAGAGNPPMEGDELPKSWKPAPTADVKRAKPRRPTRNK
jgi:hypothetical protein